MLLKKNRLNQYSLVRKLRETGRKVYSDSFTFVYQKMNEAPATKVGFIVSSKVSKKATERNRIKRLFREIMRKIIPDLKTNIVGVFLVKSDILKADPEKVEKETINLFVKENLL